MESSRYCGKGLCTRRTARGRRAECIIAECTPSQLASWSAVLVYLPSSGAIHGTDLAAPAPKTTTNTMRATRGVEQAILGAMGATVGVHSHTQRTRPHPQNEHTSPVSFIPLAVSSYSVNKSISSGTRVREVLSLGDCMGSSVAWGSHTPLGHTEESH